MKPFVFWILSDVMASPPTRGARIETGGIRIARSSRMIREMHESSFKLIGCGDVQGQVILNPCFPCDPWFSFPDLSIDLPNPPWATSSSTTDHFPHWNLMPFDQGQFNFDAPGSDAGWRRWREELDEKKRAFESRWGVVLGRRVTVCLKDHAKPLGGMLEWLESEKRGKNDPPVFRLCGLEFGVGEIKSIVQEDGR